MERVLTKNIRPGLEPMGIEEYEKAGGYQGLRKALKMDPLQIQDWVSKSNLKGRGGAGFPTGRKWSVSPMGPDARHPKYLVVNADEMEPGTMKDRLLMEGDPHQLIEGALAAAFAVQADVIYLFLRWAYKLSEERLRKAIAEAYAEKYIGKNILGSDYSCELFLHISAGRYMCGEASGMINAIQGNRAMPRHRPPRAAVSALWGMPTIVNNVETLCNVHHIVNHGWEWFKKLSRTDEGGTKIYGVSGRVKRPGLWELPMGAPAREIVEEHAGGMLEGCKFRGALPGGASSYFMVDEHLDTPMDFASMEKAGLHLGTGTMIALDDRVCPVGMIYSLQLFFARESCGWCTPCREGLSWVVKALRSIEEGGGTSHDLDVLDLHARWLRDDNTFCELAPGAMLSLESGLKYYRKDFERHIAEKRCPWNR
jgi:NADH-quinone oxidoreductase subunit F